jgi:anaerobic magnesium-protoporphyrin IX monomethyl ester cyclase
MSGGSIVILIAHSFLLRDDAKQLERHKPYPPLTTLICAAMLRGAGHDVALFDATFVPSLAAFEEALERIGPAIVLLVEDNFNFVTKMCTEARRRSALAMVAAAHARGCSVGVNGPDSSDQPGLYLAAGADAVLAGEGEFGVCDLVAAFGAGRAALEQTRGLILADAPGGLVRTLPRRQEREIDWLPLPAWDLVDVDAYRSAWTSAHGLFSWNVAASRGCPYKCNWCAKPIFGRRYVQRSAALVVEEIRRLKYDVAPDHLWFADDIFGLSSQWIAAFADEIVRRDAVTPFMMQSRVNLIDGPVAAALGSAGAEEVWLGVETGSQKILDAMDKGANVDAARTATRTLRAQGIRVGWFLQLGYPSEEWPDILRTRDLVRTEMPDEIGVSVSYPLPGTAFHRSVVAELGARRNWQDSGDLAMLFQGTYDTAFYRLVRDALHGDVKTGGTDDSAWQALEQREAEHRSPAPIRLAWAV